MMSHQIKVSDGLDAAFLRSADNSSLCYQTHSHDEFSFGLIDAGTADYQNMGQTHKIQQGDLVTINPNDAHSCNPEHAVWSYRMVYLKDVWVKDFLQSQAHSPARFAQQLVWKNSMQGVLLSAEFEQLYFTLWHSPSVFECEALLGQWLMQVLDLSQFDTAEKSDSRVCQVAEQLTEDLQANVSLSDLAAEHGLSKFQLIRQFKRAYGQAPHSYLVDQRIKTAKLKLAQGDKLADVAQAVGFCDQAHFQRIFKQRFALTPREYQQAYSA